MAPGLKFLFAVLAVLAVAGVAALLNSRATAQGGTARAAGGMRTADMIAVTGTYGSGASVLYLIDTRTRHIAVYKVDNGRKLELVAARNIALRPQPRDYNDRASRATGPRSFARGCVGSGTDDLDFPAIRENPSPQVNRSGD